jgi:NTE family protein
MDGTVNTQPRFDLSRILSWPRGRTAGRRKRARKRINLALQGGGAHGAFTWGVLDHLLEDGRLGIKGISGTSAGAVNAVMLADGLARGGPEEARTRLAEFWRAVSFGGDLPAVQRAVMERLFSVAPFEDSPMKTWLDAVGRFFSPYDFNPLNINPLEQLIERFVDFEAVRGFRELALFVSATNVRTGQLRVFKRDEINAETIMASACLPFLFHAVEIDGAPYWDGGYVGNPAIFPFFHAKQTEDVLIVQINPIERARMPRSAREIMSRVNEITFNSSLQAELRALECLHRPLNVHRIVLEDLGDRFGAASRLKNDYEFFDVLRTMGKRAARRFLDDHFDDIGARSTIEMGAEEQTEPA